MTGCCYYCYCCCCSKQCHDAHGQTRPTNKSGCGETQRAALVTTSSSILPSPSHPAPSVAQPPLFLSPTCIFFLRPTQSFSFHLPVFLLLSSVFWDASSAPLLPFYLTACGFLSRAFAKESSYI
ncbi:hypothetical protein BP00DRAFT_248587 [Aspergillus indologenus CBS 114.80]|uniref:Uncharacterized protein n=1 Tax=Aspergillus indologenus CBS 114.80 TaxID=1450541 RepID=A0A2V5HYM5_9EURO|nr:hypothetical protein BP00DRAFT_248587 [Aspergillus indologenus CBS 114.80]